MVVVKMLIQMEETVAQEVVELVEIALVEEQEIRHQLVLHKVQMAL
jgi:hypothetical protein